MQGVYICIQDLRRSPVNSVYQSYKLHYLNLLFSKYGRVYAIFGMIAELSN